MKNPRKVIGKIIPLVFGIKSLSAYAVPAIPDIQPNIPRPLLQQRNTVPSTPLQIPETSNTVTKLPKIKIVVSKFSFTGNHVFSDAQLTAALEVYTNKEISVRELNLALRRVQDLYRSKGYLLAQAYLPVQDIQKSTGETAEVQIAVLEGVLGQVLIDAPEALDKKFFGEMASYQMKSGDVLSEKNLMRNLMLLNDLPGASMFSQLNPGEAVGSSDVAVSMTPRDKANYVLFTNSFGNRFTGREQIGVAGTFNNLSGRGDQLSMMGRLSNGGGQKLFSALYSSPVDPSGTTMTLTYSHVEYTLGREFQSLDANGNSNYFSGYFDQPLIRDSIKGVYLRGGMNFKGLDDRVEAAGLYNRRDITSFEVGLVGDWVSNANDVVYQWSATMTHGNLSFKDRTAEQLDQIGLNTDGSFFKWNLSSTRTQFFENGVNWVVRADYQGANDNLDIVEKIGIGAINRWRQFAELPGLADQGYMVGTDIKRTWPISGENPAQVFRAITPFAFVDIGQGRINHDPLTSDNHVRSTHFGVGADLEVVNKWNFGITYSQQKRELDGAPDSREGRLWAQLRKEF